MPRKYKTAPDWNCPRCGRALWVGRSKWRWVDAVYNLDVCEKCACEFDAAIATWMKPYWDRRKAPAAKTLVNPPTPDSK